MSNQGENDIIVSVPSLPVRAWLPRSSRFARHFCLSSRSRQECWTAVDGESVPETALWASARGTRPEVSKLTARANSIGGIVIPTIGTSPELGGMMRPSSLAVLTLITGALDRSK